MRFIIIGIIAFFLFLYGIYIYQNPFKNEIKAPEIIQIENGPICVLFDGEIQSCNWDAWNLNTNYGHNGAF